MNIGRMMAMKDRGSGSRQRSSDRRNESGYDRARDEYDSGVYDYDRYRYRDGQFAPKPRSEMGDWGEPQGAFYDSRGRRHYDNGRYAPQDHYGMEESHPLERMGFSLDGTGKYERIRAYPDSKERTTVYVQGGGEIPERAYPNIIFQTNSRNMDDYRKKRLERIKEKEHDGMMSSHDSEKGKMDKETAEKWVRSMYSDSGHHGEKWTYEQTKQVMNQKDIHCDPAEFYAAMNAMYNDYSELAKKFGVNTVDFYAEMAKAFLEDPDAAPDKLERYYRYVVE